MTEPADIVREFCAAVSKRDIELLRPLLADDVVYHNIGMEPTVGIDAALADLSGQWATFPEAYEWQVRHLAADGNVVLVERVDTIGMNGVQAPVPVSGTFEISNGKIQRWRDYFDSALVGKMLGGEDTSKLVP